MRLYIKNMVCLRCIIVVRMEIEKLGLHTNEIVLGRVETQEVPSLLQIEHFKLALLDCGLELIDNKKTILIEKIKRLIVEMVYHSDKQLKCNFSDYLTDELKLDYTYMANVFSEIEGTTIERYVINHRIQRAKELLSYNELNLTEISWKLNYSSVAHLSTQFKKVTGITPSHFKSMNTSFPMLANV